MALIRRTHIRQLGTLALTCGLLAAPASAAAAASGGAGLGGTGAAGATANPLVQPADTPVSASGNGLTVQTDESGVTARALNLSGTAPASDAGQTVEIMHSNGPGPELTWSEAAIVPVATGGTFSAAWHARSGGRYELEAALVKLSAAAASASGGAIGAGGSGAAPLTAPPAAGTQPLTVAVYASSLATLYGPGFYGRKTACGETLRRGTIGVASRTLACGTRVSILYDGSDMVVPVIDRGPYSNGAKWDLTMATAGALGIPGTAEIGALSLASLRTAL